MIRIEISKNMKMVKKIQKLKHNLYNKKMINIKRKI